jgi:hypothetical protein
MLHTLFRQVCHAMMQCSDSHKRLVNRLGIVRLGALIKHFVAPDDCARDISQLLCAVDIGQGVNAALLDVRSLHTSLQFFPGDIHAALRDYERRRLPENRALMRLVQVCSHGRDIVCAPSTSQVICISVLPTIACCSIIWRSAVLPSCGSLPNSTDACIWYPACFT